jgi:hypothetical protein
MKQLNPGAALQAIMNTIYEVRVPESALFRMATNI